MIVEELNRVQAKYDREVVPRATIAASRWGKARMATQKWGVAFVVLYVIGATSVACAFCP